jgi:hypothetical protein
MRHKQSASTKGRCAFFAACIMLRADILLLRSGVAEFFRHVSARKQARLRAL